MSEVIMADDERPASTALLERPEAPAHLSVADATPAPEQKAKKSKKQKDADEYEG